MDLQILVNTLVHNMSNPQTNDESAGGAEDEQQCHHPTTTEDGSQYVHNEGNEQKPHNPVGILKLADDDEDEEEEEIVFICDDTNDVDDDDEDDVENQIVAVGKKKSKRSRGVQFRFVHDDSSSSLKKNDQDPQDPSERSSASTLNRRNPIISKSKSKHALKS